ncbi:MAG: 2-oxoacid:acceptor oxidoreductase family protein [Deltaproteobacteria bacterium]|nr:2-oxoacid:acceptor oxidoreductase family protein [Deltaproteobacteria bacterium]MBW1962849.1 2-oxoacid:acceptor oxidoreductase family protein [Deltaproteobacteria bacterium]MBW1994575.1 2-oxoacid:acceptor oxidoreductase family protein [Deltaproteobacteria bacterium]MBW2154375.1 2-oxoacid:acceptor oxidoreductase family protein [Deltaproteobacteria bacterium]
MPRKELTIAGVGGQGSILAGVILGSAAVTYDKKYAVQTQAYSAELRGGFAAAWVIVSDEPVIFPRVTRPDILVAQAQDSINRFGAVLRSEGILIFDSDLIPSVPEKIKNAYAIKATSLARSRFQAPIVCNMIMLGALCRVGGVVSRQAFEAAIVDAVPKGKEELNLNAFDTGYDEVRKICGNKI